MPVLTPREALEQSAEYWGVDLYREYNVGDEVLQLCHPEYFDDDTQAAYDALMLEAESWDHEDVQVYDAFGRPVIDADGQPKTVSQLKTPHRKTDAEGKVTLKNFNVELCKALWGPAGYKKFKAAGGSANQVRVDLREMEIEFQKLVKERLKADPKSRAGTQPAEASLDAD